MYEKPLDLVPGPDQLLTDLLDDLGRSQFKAWGSFLFQFHLISISWELPVCRPELEPGTISTQGALMCLSLG